MTPRDLTSLDAQSNRAPPHPHAFWCTACAPLIFVTPALFSENKLPQTAASGSSKEANGRQPKNRCCSRRSARCTFTSCSRRRKEYLWHAGGDGDSKEVHGQGHPSHHDDQQAVARVAMGAQALLQNVNQMRSFQQQKNKCCGFSAPVYSRELQPCR